MTQERLDVKCHGSRPDRGSETEIRTRAKRHFKEEDGVRFGACENMWHRERKT